MKCSSCGFEMKGHPKFCQQCGDPLSEQGGGTSAGGANPPAVVTVAQSNQTASGGCPACGAAPSEITNRVCGSCGVDVDDFVKQSADAERKLARAHLETTINERVALVCDIGRSHQRNDDAGLVADELIAGVQTQICIVCDGVSQSQNPDIASEAATKGALEVVRTKLAAGSTPRQALEAAMVVANKAVLDTEYDPKDKVSRAASTVVALIVRDGVVTYGWAGDSRAYVIKKGEKGYVAARLTVDQSWLNDAVKKGMSFEDANKNPLAHAIEEYLGDPDINPCYDEAPTTDAVMFIVCTDGYWNLPDSDESKPPQAVADAVFAVGEGASALAIAQALVNNANSFDGHDNVTVGVVKKQN